MYCANVNDITEIMPENYLLDVEEIAPPTFRNKSVKKKDI